LQLLLETGEVVGETKKMLQADKISYKIPYPVAMDSLIKQSGEATKEKMDSLIKNQIPNFDEQSEDYKKAKIPKLPVTSGIKTTKFNIFIYALILFPVAISPFLFNFSGLTYFMLATILSGYYLFISFKLLKEKNSIIEKKLAAKLFGYSIIYLFMIFTSILIDRII